MATNVLDKLRDAAREERRSRNGNHPGEPRARVYVTPTGRVVIRDRQEREQRDLSEVRPATFA